MAFVLNVRFNLQVVPEVDPPGAWIEPATIREIRGFEYVRIAGNCLKVFKNGRISYRQATSLRQVRLN